MRNLIALFVCVLLNTGMAAHGTDYVDSIKFGENWDIDQNTVILPSAVIGVQSINLQRSLHLENRATVSGDIRVCPNCDLFLQNSGAMSGTIYLGDGANLIQVIKTSADITRINTSGPNFSILVQCHESLRLSDIMSIAMGADKITLDNSSILFGAGPRFFGPRQTPQNIELIGEVIIKVDNPYALDGRVILSNVSGDGAITINAPTLDPLYVARAEYSDTNVYLHIGREMDYTKILGKSMGGFANGLRSSSYANPTLRAMDRASTMSELQNVMDQSVVFNPINLMRPIKTFNNFEITPKNANFGGAPFALEPIFITSSGMNLYAGRLSMDIPKDDWIFSLSGYVGDINSADDINKFSGSFYGANAGVYFNDKSLWMHSVLGFSVSSFETGPIFNGTSTSNNPTGISVYGVTDFGLKFDVTSGFYATPFIGFGSEYDAILHQNDLSLFARAGGIFGFSETELGIKYDYEAFASAQTDDVQNIGIGLNIWSIADGAGGGISYALSNDEFGISHKLSAELKFLF